ncbi:MAG: hypothetical protein LBG13_01030 [Holosporales bacterium]|nr:hypothetical protein [Holosporales bacterium]
MSLEKAFSQIGKSLDNFFQMCSALPRRLLKRREKQDDPSQDQLPISAPYPILIFDSLISFFSIFISIHLRIGMDFLDYSPRYIIENMLVFGLVSTSVSLWLQTYQSFWKYTSVEDAVPIFLSVIISNSIFFPLMLLMNKEDFFPYSVLVINVFVLFLMLIVPRVTVRILYNNRMNKIKSMEIAQREEERLADTTQVILVGSPAAVDMFLRDVISNDDVPFNFDPVAILSISSSDVGRSIKGVPIIGSVKQLGLALKELSRGNINPKQIVVTERNIHEDVKNFLVSYVQEHGLLLMHVFYQYSFNQVVRSQTGTDNK